MRAMSRPNIQIAHNSRMRNSKKHSRSENRCVRNGFRTTDGMAVADAESEQVSNCHLYFATCVPQPGSRSVRMETNFTLPPNREHVPTMVRGSVGSCWPSWFRLEASWTVSGRTGFP